MRAVSWISPDDCFPPHCVTHPLKLEELIEKFKRDGWNPHRPALIGYTEKVSYAIQLISGSHRWAAAKEAKILIPISLYERSEVEEIWGTDRWVEMLLNPPEAGYPTY